MCICSKRGLVSKEKQFFIFNTRGDIDIFFSFSVDIFSEKNLMDRLCI